MWMHHHFILIKTRGKTKIYPKRSYLWTMFMVQSFISLLYFVLSINVSRFERKRNGLIPYTEEQTLSSARSRFACLAGCDRSDTCLGVTLMMMMLSETIDCRMFEFDRNADLSSVKYYNVTQTDPSHVKWVTSRLEDLNVDLSEGKSSACIDQMALWSNGWIPLYRT